jgi:hypothetical protein
MLTGFVSVLGVMPYACFHSISVAERDGTLQHMSPCR